MTSSTDANFKARLAKRTRVLMTGALVTADGTRTVTVRDISRHGAGVSGLDRISDKCEVLFRLNTASAAARIVWSKDRAAGLKFYRELTSEDMRGALQPPLRNFR